MESERPRVLAIVPARGGSRRLQRKNLQPLAGRPLLAHTLATARRSSLITRLCVSTDDAAIRDTAVEHGADVPFLRPSEHAADHVHASVPVLDMLERLGGAAAWSHCVMLLPTSPLRSVTDIDAVIGLSVERSASVVTVAPLGKSLHHLRSLNSEGRLETLVPLENPNIQTQDVEPLYVLNGSIYCAPVVDLLQHRTFHLGPPLAWIMERERSVDIDTKDDLHLAGLLVAPAETVAGGR